MSNGLFGVLEFALGVVAGFAINKSIHHFREYRRLKGLQDR